MPSDEPTIIQQSSIAAQSKRAQPILGFWACWSLTVGIMIGSGVFLLPAVLAPYGLLSFGGWLLTGGGSILVSLVFARLASRNHRSGGVYIYTRDAFGDLAGFLIAWGYWASYWIAIPAIAVAFVGYLSVFFPTLDSAPQAQGGIALLIMWTAIAINVKGLKEAALAQLIMTILKLLPLLMVMGLGLLMGSDDNLPEMNPQQLPLLEVLATTALITMWAFSGMEAGTVPAGNVKNPQTTVPRAIVLGTLTVAVVYIGSTLAVMTLVPADVLATSTSPFADAARTLGSWGPPLIALGALISTAGALNGTVFVAGHMPMAVALDGLAPATLGKRNRGAAPYLSFAIVALLTTALLLGNYSRGLIGIFKFLIMMSTLAFMLPLIVCSLAEFLHSWKSAKAWAAVAMLALLYSIFAVLGSGLAVIGWGLAFLLLGVPVFYLGRQRRHL
ncbi:MAG: amino acid permease [Gammaproteobacteria bacterium]|nr:amino acid permease [Gammaproteobacteria bacterium]